MQFSLVKELQRGENRVALTPSGVSALTEAGHEVFVQSMAGAASHFSDQEYLDAGASLVYSSEEAFGRGSVVVKVQPPLEEEVEHITPGSTLVSFLQLAAGRNRLLDRLIEECVTAIGLELVTNSEGTKPLVTVMSEIAGQLAIQFAANLMLTNHGGRGLLLGSIPGVSGAVVVIIGAGKLGTMAARTALGVGSQVVLLDRSVPQLRRAQEKLGNVITMTATAHNLARSLSFADIAVGAITVPGHRTPHVVSREMVRSMKRGAVIMDTSVDMGGCFETSRPTTIESPTFESEGVLHCCIPNLPSLVCRTSSRAFSNSVVPRLLDMAARDSLAEAFLEDPCLREGVVCINGRVTNADLARLYGREEGDLMQELRALREEAGETKGGRLR